MEEGVFMSKENKHELSTAKNNRTIIIEELNKFIDIIINISLYFIFIYTSRFKTFIYLFF